MKPFSMILATAVLIAAPAFAQQAAPRTVRGVITDVQAMQITVKPDSGAPIVVNLTPTWTVSVTKPITVAEITPGSFIGTTEMPQADGGGRSMEVHVFPAGVKVGEGHYPWDSAPGAMMTNGTVGTVSASPNGRELDVSYPNGQRKITVPPNAPIVLITPGDRSLIKTGIPVFMTVGGPAGGPPSASSVVIGENGAKPPM